MIDTITHIQLIADAYKIPADIYDMGTGRDECVLRADKASFHITCHTSGVNEFFNVRIINDPITKRLTIRDTDNLLTNIERFCKEHGEHEEL